MKPLNFKKLFCVLLSASILVPSVAKAEAPMSVPPVPDHNSSKSAEFMKKNWPYFAAGVPGVVLIGGLIIWGVTHGGKKEQPRALQADPSNIPITAAQWKARVDEYTARGMLPGAQVWAECAKPTALGVLAINPLPCYFFEITNLDTFKNYLHERCQIAEGSDKEQKILEWANHIFYKDLDVNKPGGGVKYEDTIAGIFGGNDGGSTFANDLNDAVKYFDNDLATSDRSMESRLISRSDDGTKVLLTTSFARDLSRMTGLPALNGRCVRQYVAPDSQTELVGNPYEPIIISTPSTASVPVSPVASEGSTTTTTTTTTTATTTIAPPAPVAAAAENGRAKHLGTAKAINHAYVNGLRFGRVGYDGNAIGKGLNAVVGAVQGKTDMTNTRICYWVEDLVDFVAWVKTLFNGQFDKEAEEFAVNVLMHQNRWLLQETCARKSDEPAAPADQPQPESVDPANESSNGGFLANVAWAATNAANFAADAARALTNATVGAATTTEWTTGTAFSYNANAWDKGCQAQLNSNGDEQRKKAMDDNVPDNLAKTLVGDLPFGGPVYKDARCLDLNNQGAGRNFCHAITREGATEQALLDQKESFDNIIAAYGYRNRVDFMSRVEQSSN